ncbi:type II secretion system protein N [Congregibacter brevis]|uniref:Type II secretion system protein N n=1 Tax=Congregibacter brevis TaxID=3081201 RepID=A0ABZ0IIU1_9GAMM|nr:type II secretion system protein N [Congregibacter sp. IMCC45268]
MRLIFWLPVFIVVAVLLFAASLRMPARLLPFFLNEEQVQLSGISGAIGEGTAVRARVQTPGGYLHLGKLTWTLDPLSVLTLSPKVNLRSAWGDQRGTLDLRIDGDALAIQNLDVSVDAALLKRLLPIELSGRLELVFDELLVTRRDVMAADGRVVWQDAAWQSPQGVRVLGSYVATIDSPAPRQVVADIVTLSGPVVAAGEVDLDEQRFNIDLFIESSTRALDADLAQALSLIASPEENGYRLRLDGEVARGP